MRVCEGGWRECYFVFNSFMACGKTLLWNLAILLRGLPVLFPESTGTDRHTLKHAFHTLMAEAAIQGADLLIRSNL